MPPLTNKRILVTRPRGQASTLATLLEQQGATVIQIPTIEIAPPDSWKSLDEAIRNLASYDWLILTSANAVRALADRAGTLGIPLTPPKTAVIGPATASAILLTGSLRQISIIPPRFIAESLAESLLPHAPGAKMLLLRATAARDIIPATLRAAGAKITIAEAYKTIVPTASIESLRTLFTTTPPDAITFTSASTATNLCTLLDAANLTIPPETTLASIGPITSQAMRDNALKPALEAAESTIPSLVQSLCRHFET